MRRSVDPLVTKSVAEAIGRVRSMRPATLALLVGALSLPRVIETLRSFLIHEIGLRFGGIFDVIAQLLEFLSAVAWFVFGLVLIRYFWNDARNSTTSLADAWSETVANWRTILLVVLIVVLLYAAVGALGTAINAGLQALDWGYSGGVAWWELAIVLPYYLSAMSVITATVLWSLPLAVIGKRGAVKVVKRSFAFTFRRPASSLAAAGIVILPPVIATVILPPVIVAVVGTVLAQGIRIAYLVAHVAGAALQLYSIVYLATFLAAETNPVLQDPDSKAENE